MKICLFGCFPHWLPLLFFHAEPIFREISKINRHYHNRFSCLCTLERMKHHYLLDFWILYSDYWYLNFCFWKKMIWSLDSEMASTKKADKPILYMDPLAFRRSAVGTILNPKTGRDIASSTFGRLTGFSVRLSEVSTQRILLEIIFKVIYHLNELHRNDA